MRINANANLCPAGDIYPGDVFKMKSVYYMRVHPLNIMRDDVVHAVDLENGLLEQLENDEKVEPLVNAALHF